MKQRNSSKLYFDGEGSGDEYIRKASKRGRKPNRVDTSTKLERSRQSARECRARKKLRYQYLEELVTAREQSVFSLRKELETVRQYCMEVDNGTVPPALVKYMQKDDNDRSDDEDDDQDHTVNVKSEKC